jgi:hypothetical protein
MLEEEKLMPLYSRDENLPQRVMALVPALKVSIIVKEGNITSH